MAADREHELVVGEMAAIGERELARARVDRGDGIAEHQLAVDGLVIRGMADRQALDVEFAGEEFLGERRALVGQGGLAADHDEASGEAVAAQAVDDLRGGMTASGDDDGVLHAR